MEPTTHEKAKGEDQSEEKALPPPPALEPTSKWQQPFIHGQGVPPSYPPPPYMPPYPPPPSAKDAEHYQQFVKWIQGLMDDFKSGRLTSDPSCFEWNFANASMLCRTCIYAGKKTAFTSRGSTHRGRKALIEHMKTLSHQSAVDFTKRRSMVPPRRPPNPKPKLDPSIGHKRKREQIEVL